MIGQATEVMRDPAEDNAVASCDAIVVHGSKTERSAYWHNGLDFLRNDDVEVVFDAVFRLVGSLFKKKVYPKPCKMGCYSSPCCFFTNARMSSQNNEPPARLHKLRHSAFRSSLFFFMTIIQLQQRVQGMVVSNRLVLIGGGHAHAQVLRALNKQSRPTNLQVTLIDIQKSASYSGMIPSCVAKIYTPDQTLLHLEPLCNWAGIEFINDEVVHVDLEKQSISLRHTSEPLFYDAVSFDIGSKSRGVDDIPGVAQYAIPTRPISKLVERIDAAEQKLGYEAHVVVVGGGAAGIELAMSMRGRWLPILKDRLQVTLLDAGEEFLPNESPVCREALRNVLTERDIKILHGCLVQKVTESHVELENGRSIPYTHCLWAGGAAAHPLAEKLQQSGLSVSKRGWIRVNGSLQSVSHGNIFAAGDCCTMELPGGKLSPPKAGVYAVRSGPVLIQNLTRYMQSKDLIHYEPQDDFLKLLACGDGTALGFRFGIPVRGKWVFQLKDHIDQMFMNLFKEANLPRLHQGTEYDTSQYDTLDDGGRTRLNPSEAANLLQRSDDEVDYLQAWYVIRDMADDREYRSQVLASFAAA
jgi:selenide,water dikinase